MQKRSNSRRGILSAKVAIVALALVGLLLIGSAVHVAVAPTHGQATQTVQAQTDDQGDITIEEDETPLASGAEIAKAGSSSGDAVSRALGASSVVAVAAGVALAISRQKRRRQ